MERAIEWLERGYDRRDPDMPYLGMLWLSDQLRSTPGYEDLVRRMDFPDAVMSRLDPVARESDP
jgi:hypothetical protein